MRRWIIILAAVLTCAAADAAKVGLIKIDGAIGPATASYISRAIDLSSERKDECLIIQLDTPGGLLDSTKVIVQKFLASSVPIVVCVGPPGAHAGSAGCFITIAADVEAAWPPRVGAAHPVSIGGQIPPAARKTDDTMKRDGEFRDQLHRNHRRQTQPNQAGERKCRHQFEKALEMNVIDIIAKDLPDLPSNWVAK